MITDPPPDPGVPRSLIEGVLTSAAAILGAVYGAGRKGEKIRTLEERVKALEDEKASSARAIDDRMEAMRRELREDFRMLRTELREDMGEIRQDIRNALRGADT